MIDEESLIRPNGLSIYGDEEGKYPLQDNDDSRLDDDYNNNFHYQENDDEQ